MAAESYDVIVVGGGAAGVGAAVGASRAGARTLLVESGPCLGGAATQRGVLTYCGLYTHDAMPRQAVAGVAEEVMAGLRRLDGVIAPQRLYTGRVVALFDAEALKLALDRICRAAGVETLLHTLVTAAARQDGRINEASLHDHRGTRAVAGKAFVDASGEGDLAFFAGAATRYGVQGAVQMGTLALRLGGIPPDADISADGWAAAIREARERGAPLRKERGLIVRLPLSGDVCAYLVDAAYDARDGRSIGAAEAAGREQAWHLLAAIRTVRGCENAYLSVSGPSFGTRQSRHIAALHQLREEEVREAMRFEDAVALGAWPMEYHPPEGGPTEWGFIGGDGTYDIPLRCLQSRDTPNLFAAGRTADGDRNAGASLRVMGTAFATGHAAGIAAALTAGGGSPAEAGPVRAELLRQGALLGL